MFKDFLHIFYPQTYELSNGKIVKEKFNWGPYVVIALIIATVISGKVTGFSFETLFRRGHVFFDFFDLMFPPRWAFWSEIKKPLIDTINMSLLGTAIGCLISLPVSFYLASNFKLNKTYLSIHRGVLSVFRTLPTLIYARLISIVIGTGTLAGTISIAIFSFSVCVKMLYEQLETIDMGPYEALESTGANRVRCMITAAYPQIRSYFWSTVLYCFEMNVRSAAILGYVGAGGIGVQINNTLGWREYTNTGLMIFALVLVVVIIETISREIRRRLVQG